MPAPDRVFLVSTAVLYVLAGALLAGLCSMAAPTAEQDPASAVAVVGLATSVFIASLAAGAARLSRRPLDATLRLGPGRLPWGETCVLVVGTLGLSQLLDAGIDWSGLRGESVLAELDASLLGARGRTLALAFAGIAIGPGIAEELLFRGALQSALLRVRALPPALAVATASLAFGAAHLDPIHAPAAAILGLHLGAIAYVSGGIRAAVAAHVVNNLLSVGASAYGLYAGPPVLQLGVASLLLAPAVVVLARRWPGARVAWQAAPESGPAPDEPPRAEPPASDRSP